MDITATSLEGWLIRRILIAVLQFRVFFQVFVFVEISRPMLNTDLAPGPPRPPHATQIQLSAATRRNLRVVQVACTSLALAVDRNGMHFAAESEKCVTE